MTELMVVIGIIAVLAGILLTVMRGVRTKSLKTQTIATMEQFSRAADAFQLVHGRYPGVLHEQIFANTAFSGVPPISGMENALLDLMGGFRLLAPSPSAQAQAEYDAYGGTNSVTPNLGSSGYQLKYDVNKLGEGPVIQGRPYPPYFTPSESQLAVAGGQLRAGGAQPECCPQLDDCPSDAPCLPDLLDAWGQPIIYVRRARTAGPLAGPLGTSPEPQFYMESMNPYLKSTGLGKYRKDQTFRQTSGAYAGSILNTTQANPYATFAQIIRHPSLGATAAGGLSADDVALSGTAQGAYVLISAGPDGVYFDAQDGPGTPGASVGNIVSGQYGTPTVVKQYDDIRVFGGG